MKGDDYDIGPALYDAPKTNDSAGPVLGDETKRDIVHEFVETIRGRKTGPTAPSQPSKCRHRPTDPPEPSTPKSWQISGVRSCRRTSSRRGRPPSKRSNSSFASRLTLSASRARRSSSPTDRQGAGGTPAVSTATHRQVRESDSDRSLHANTVESLPRTNHSWAPLQARSLHCVILHCWAHASQTGSGVWCPNKALD